MTHAFVTVGKIAKATRVVMRTLLSRKSKNECDTFRRRLETASTPFAIIQVNSTISTGMLSYDIILCSTKFNTIKSNEQFKNVATPNSNQDHLALSLSKLTSLVDNNFKCSICLDTFSDPHVIPECLHRFCGAWVKDSLGNVKPSVQNVELE